MTRSATPGEPETEAGRRLFARLWGVDSYDRASQIIATVQHDILAIEAEARAKAESIYIEASARVVEEVRAESSAEMDLGRLLGVEKLMVVLRPWLGIHNDLELERACRRILAELTA